MSTTNPYANVYSQYGGDATLAAAFKAIKENAYCAGAEAFRLAAMNAIEAEVRSLEGKLPKRTSFTTHYATNSLRAAERAIEILPIPSWEE